MKPGTGRCFFDTGCRNPVPVLSDAEEAAFSVFIDCQTQWKWLGGFGAARVGLDYQGARQVADAHGLAWTWPLLKRLQACERAVLAADRIQQERAAQQAENQRAAGIVN